MANIADNTYSDHGMAGAQGKDVALCMEPWWSTNLSSQHTTLSGQECWTWSRACRIRVDSGDVGGIRKRVSAPLGLVYEVQRNQELDLFVWKYVA